MTAPNGFDPIPDLPDSRRDRPAATTFGTQPTVEPNGATQPQPSPAPAYAAAPTPATGYPQQQPQQPYYAGNAAPYPPQGYPVQPYPPQPADTGSFGWAVLGFFFPIVGLILYIVWKDTKPLSARKAGMGALVSVIAVVVIWILTLLLIFLIAAIAGASA